MNPDPTALVQEYNRRDNQGAFLRTNRWLDSAYVCPGHLGGPDMFRVVRDGSIVDTDVRDTLAFVMVRSFILGVMGQDSLGFVFEYEPGVAVDTFKLVLTPFGWRIRSPQLPNLVLASWVLGRQTQITLRPMVRDSLEHSIHREGRRAPDILKPARD